MKIKPRENFVHVYNVCVHARSRDQIPCRAIEEELELVVAVGCIQGISLPYYNHWTLISSLNHTARHSHDDDLCHTHILV